MDVLYDPRDEVYMKEALKEAYKAYQEDEVPIGAVVVCNNKIIGRGYNQTEKLNDVTAHAEMLAITAAANSLNGKYLPQCTIYITVEPCIMCAGALGWSQIGRIVFGTHDPKKGFTNFCTKGKTPLHPQTIVTAKVMEAECKEILTDFFRKKRK